MLLRDYSAEAIGVDGDQTPATPNEYLDSDEVEMMLAIEISAAKAMTAETGADPDDEIDAAMAALAGRA